MPSFSRSRVAARRVRWPSGLLLAVVVSGFTAGCLPALEDQCTVDGDCPAERPVCVARICTPRIGEAVDALPDGPSTGDDGVGPDDLGADRGVPPDMGDLGPCTPSGAESCNGADDDCDGVVDEAPGGEPLSRPCYTGNPDSQGIGVCRSGRALCTDGAYGTCEGERVPLEEVCPAGDDDCAGLCNGEDDDCDGMVDEGLVVDCGPDAIGLCRRGTRQCAGGFIQQDCIGAVEPAAVDICDGEDNDCDLAVDEDDGDCQCGAGESRPCYSGPAGTQGQGVCADGFQDCGPDGSFGACVDQITPSSERCDGVDNDCDGTPDERLGGQPCSVGRGACLRPGMTLCDGQRERCDAVAGEPVDELCNGEDDDCDGTADEGFRLGEPCSRGVGACQTVGERICRGDRAVCDAVAGEPGDETCNGVDDDCDGETDENAAGDGPLEQSCYDQPGGNPGVGACTEGSQVCADGRWGQCVGDQQPFDEVCNGADDDCNGAVDDVEGGDCSCIIGEQRGCYGGPDDTEMVGVCRGGTQRCVALDDGGTGFGPCDGEVLPGDELCNGEDDDCDGAIDEGGFGDCAAGDGACARDGVVRCVDERLICDAMPGEPMDEVCNDADDDCNGLVDDIAAEPCEVGQGVCRNTGRLRCGADGAECDVAPGAPGAETCNRQDDDCDGQTDEAVPAEPCEVGVGACVADGMTACRDGVSLCMGEPGQGGPEACNNADDDCDGLTDEGTFGDCMVGEGACAGPGELVCVDGMPQCQGEGGAGVDEVCNGEDDDCDDAADENPGDICPDVPNASAECRAAECVIGCLERFVDADDDPDTGCERGCGAEVGGVEIDTNGLPLDVAARPDVDEFAIVWLDSNGAPWMSIEGQAPFAIGGQGGQTGTAIQVIGVVDGYSVLLLDGGVGYAIDVRVNGGAAVSTQVFGEPDGVPGLALVVREPDPLGGPDAVPVVQFDAAVVGQGGDELALVPRSFGADFGPAATVQNSGTGWVATSMSTTVVGGRPVVAGAAAADRGRAVLRLMYLDGQQPANAEARNPADGNLRTALAARDDQLVLAYSGSRATGVFGFQAAVDPGAAVPLGAGAVIGVQFGSAGPVVSAIESRDLVSTGFEFGANGLGPVYGPLPLVAQNAGAGRIDAAATTLTTTDRRIIVWRDQQNDVRWAENPCL